jgi:hypothetical protein
MGGGPTTPSPFGEAGMADHVVNTAERLWFTGGLRDGPLRLPNEASITSNFRTGASLRTGKDPTPP